MSQPASWNAIHGVHVAVAQICWLDQPTGPPIMYPRNKISGQIIATSHDLTPNGGLVGEIPLFQGNSGW